jgi:uncharacterized protein
MKLKTPAPLILFVLARVLLLPFAMEGQDLKGQWNGALQVQGTELRLVFHITMKDSLYSATLDSPDQHASGIKVTAVDFNYPNVKVEISTLGVVYEGTLSGNRITGVWRQSGQTFPLVFIKEEDQPK